MHLVAGYTRDTVSPVGRSQESGVFGVILVAVEALQCCPVGGLPGETKGEVTTCFHVLAARSVAIFTVVVAVEGIAERGVDVVMAGSAHVVTHQSCLGLRHLK
jgi:hypothetical protein